MLHACTINKTRGAESSEERKITSTKEVVPDTDGRNSEFGILPANGEQSFGRATSFGG
jgi:hypothetical protein